MSKVCIRTNFGVFVSAYMHIPVESWLKLLEFETCGLSVLSQDGALIWSKAHEEGGEADEECYEGDEDDEEEEEAVSC